MQEKTKDCESEVENMAKFGINDILNAKTKAAGQQAQTEGYKEIYLSPYEVKAAQENTHQKLEKGNSGKGSREKGRGRLRNTAPRKHNVFVLFLSEIQGLQRKNGNVPEMRPVHKQGRG